MRFFEGKATQDDVKRELAGQVESLSVLTCLYSLLDHPDPKQRDPALVLRTLDERPALHDVEWRFLVETVAKVRTQDWAGAEAAFANHFTVTDALILSPSAYDFIRALIYSHVGREDAARESYARGMAEWNRLTVGNPAAWERSDAMRWRREAEAALRK